MVVCKECGIDTKEYNVSCKTCFNRKKSKEHYQQNKEKFRTEAWKRLKKRNEQLKGKGICITCLTNKAREGKTQCKLCAEKNREIAKIRMKKRREDLLEKGICISCGSEKSIEGKNFCEKCLLKRRERALERIEELRQTGKCLHCGEEKELYSEVLCKECTIKQRVKTGGNPELKYFIKITSFRINFSKKLLNKLKWNRVRLEYDFKGNIIKIAPEEDINYGLLIKENKIKIKDFKEYFRINAEGKFEAIYNKDDNIVYIDLNKVESN